MSLCSPENAPDLHDLDTHSLPILYSFRRCPYAMRARLALNVAGIRYRLREVVLREKPEAMLAISPKGTVPVLHLPDGTVLEESREVMAWALAQNDPASWLDVDPVEAETFIDDCDGPFKHALDRYKYPNRYGLNDGFEHRALGQVFLERINDRLETDAYLFGAEMRYADAAIFPFIRQFANADREWFDVQPYSRLQRWLEGHLESERFARIMVKHPQWHAGDVEPILPAAV
ncbi:MAG: glutathione S-transferase [Pseudomonadota bacterium]